MYSVIHVPHSTLVLRERLGRVGEGRLGAESQPETNGHPGTLGS